LSKPKVTIIGGGIVGLAAAYYLTREGAQVAIVDRDPHGDKVSLGNAASIAVTEVVPASAPGALWRVAGWMLDPLGPLTVRPTYAPKLVPWLVRFARSGTLKEVERISLAVAALNSRAHDDLIPMLEGTGLSGELKRHGALTVYETQRGYVRDLPEWQLKQSLGIVLEEMSGAEARRLEPALGPRVCRAVLTPQWSHVTDPKRLVYGIQNWLMSQRVTIRRGTVSNIVADLNSVLLELDNGERISTDIVVVAAGAWSGLLARRLGDRVLLESERGYNSTLPESGISLHRPLVFAEQKFVATPLSCGLRIGGAAEFGGLNAPENFKRSRALLQSARRYLPNLRITGGTNWAGHRPTTPDSLPVIGPSKANPRVFYAFGHGHLGLTQAATTGCLITDLIFHRPPSVDMKPYNITRFT
jgi:D-amino-acid dehydrogenase